VQWTHCAVLTNSIRQHMSDCDSIGETNLTKLTRPACRWFLQSGICYSRSAALYRTVLRSSFWPTLSHSFIS